MPLVQKVDDAIQWKKKLYPVNNAVGFPYAYLLESAWFIQWIVLSNVWTTRAWTAYKNGLSYL